MVTAVPCAGTKFADQNYIDDSWSESPNFRFSGVKEKKPDAGDEKDEEEDSSEESSADGTASSSSPSTD